MKYDKTKGSLIIANEDLAMCDAYRYIGSGGFCFGCPLEHCLLNFKNIEIEVEENE